LYYDIGYLTSAELLAGYANMVVDARRKGYGDLEIGIITWAIIMLIHNVHVKVV
jgi:hypothetical protein